MEEYNLSEHVKEVINYLNEQNGCVFIPRKSDASYNFFKIFISRNKSFFREDMKAMAFSRFIITENYQNSIEYMYNFLLMCEDLFNGEQPTINRFNEAKLRELKNGNIVDFKENRGEIKEVEVLSFNLLEDEYFNMRYNVRDGMFTNIQNSNTDNSVNIIDSKIENSNIQINCNITENDINDIVQVIQMVIAMDRDVPEELKDELESNKKDKNKLQGTLTKFSKWFISSSATAQINASIPILTNIALQALSN